MRMGVEIIIIFDSQKFLHASKIRRFDVWSMDYKSALETLKIMNSFDCKLETQKTHLKQSSGPRLFSLRNILREWEHFRDDLT